jgi:peptidoglycan/LPS O-acetylase OafA/YrhL
VLKIEPMPTLAATEPITQSDVFSGNQAKVKSTYQPQLDGLRALAIIGILFEHFDLQLPVMFRCGPLSVRFFFVLTGYFITLSLWRVRGQMDETQQGFLPLARYYLARLLRTGPPFYLSLIIGALFGIEEVRTNILWLATFQANHYIVHLGYWPDAISHYWSLAVQEQFYFLWPLIVLTLPKRWFLPVMAAFIVFGLAFRIGCIMTNASTITRWVTLFGCIDSFAIGALVAFLKQSSILDKMWQSRILLVAMPLAAFACFYLGRALMTLPEGNVWLGATETVDGVFLAWLLAASLRGIGGRYGQMLSWSPLVYLGKISYGIYVYHVFIIVLVSPLLIPYGMTAEHNPWARIAVLTGLTLIASSLSWHFLEQPFLAWKNGLGVKRQPVLPPALVQARPAFSLSSTPAVQA